MNSPEILPLVPTPVKEIKSPFSKKHISGLFSSISVQDKINFARHLAMIVKAGMPVQEGLRIILSQTESKVLQKIITQLIEDLNNGHFLADSLEQYENLFGPFFVNIVRVGESSGTLGKNLLYLAEEIRKAKMLKSKVRSAMVYPIVILLATLAMVGFLTFFVFPKLIPLFRGFNVKLPATTTALITAADFLQNYGLYSLIIIAGLIFLFRVLVNKVPPFKYFLHRIILVTPVIAPLSISINIVNFCRVLALLLKSGVTIVDSLAITSKTFENLVYRKAVLQAEADIRRGEQLAVYLTKRKKIFPLLVSGMIRIGENTGNLEENLDYLAEYYDDEMTNKLSGLTSLLEPLLLLTMGLVVGFVALSIITPIYSISQGIK